MIIVSKRVISASERVARFAVETDSESLIRATGRWGRDTVLDTVACAVAAIDLPSARIAMEYACGFGSDDGVSGIGARSLLPVPAATFLNASLASALDYDDGSFWSLTHPGASVVPTALAVGESTRATGQDVLAAVIVGYEVAIRSGAALNFHFRDRLYGSGTSGALGAAAVASRLYRLGVKDTEHALGIARANMPIASARESISAGVMIKESIGWGAFTGVSAALLARLGMTASSSSMTEPQWPVEFQPLRYFDDLGTRYELPNIYVKLYPGCQWSHAAVAALLGIRKREGITAADVERIVVRTHAAGASLHNKSPRSAEASQYSLPFTLAVALIDGEIAPHRLTLKRLSDKVTVATAARVEIEIDPYWDKAFPSTRGATVHVICRGGQEFADSVAALPGYPGRQLSAQQYRQKFFTLVAPVLGRPATEKLHQAIYELAEIRNVGDFTQLLRSSDLDTGRSAS